MNIYQEWNFKDNPFKTSALPAEDVGDRLIAGREAEIRQLTKRLYNQPQIPTLEGLNGIGKTSLINVAIYRSFKNFIKNKEKSPLFIPCIKTFQISTEVEIDNFLDNVYLEIAQTIIKYQEDLKKLGVKLPKNLDEIDTWLNQPYTKSYEGSISALTIQLGGGQSKEANTSIGFERSGFHRSVRNWLVNMFPQKDFGGIVCVIDNLELLEKSATAKKVIAKLRDELFNVHGIRWVMCGSLGIVTSLVSSPRLEGIMHDPIQVNGILKMHLSDVFSRRIESFRAAGDVYLPINEQAFRMLFDILKGNIRNTLKYTNDYCNWVDDKGMYPISDTEKESTFMLWLMEKSNRYWKEINAHIKPKTLQLFKDAVSVDGIFALTDFELFSYTSSASMKNCIKDLEAVGIVESVIDEKDNRRKSIQITPKGWFISNLIEVESK